VLYLLVEHAYEVVGYLLNFLALLLHDLVELNNETDQVPVLLGVMCELHSLELRYLVDALVDG
jgi:hypothetical protein